MLQHKINIIGNCYRLINVLKNANYQHEHIKRLELCQNFNN